MIKLESVPNTGEVTPTRLSALSQLVVVVFAVTVSSSLPVMVFAQQQTQNNMAQPRTALQTPTRETNQ
jgi:hypothetical protein